MITENLMLKYLGNGWSLLSPQEMLRRVLLHIPADKVERESLESGAYKISDEKAMDSVEKLIGVTEGLPKILELGDKAREAAKNYEKLFRERNGRILLMSGGVFPFHKELNNISIPHIYSNKVKPCYDLSLGDLTHFLDPAHRSLPGVCDYRTYIPREEVEEKIGKYVLNTGGYKLVYVMHRKDSLMTSVKFHWFKNLENQFPGVNFEKMVLVDYSTLERKLAEDLKE